VSFFFRGVGLLLLFSVWVWCCGYGYVVLCFEVVDVGVCEVDG
jgi:hypothetical protein